jgi:hypothetical protein
MKEKWFVEIWPTKKMAVYIFPFKSVKIYDFENSNGLKISRSHFVS